MLQENETNSSDKIAIKEKIRAFLQSISPEEYNAKSISKIMRVNYNTVRASLNRLYNEGKIKKNHRGFYRGIIDIDAIVKKEQQDIRLHGIKLQGSLLNIRNKGRTGYSLDADTLTYHAKHSETHSYLFECWSVKITIHQKGLVEVWCKSTDRPMNVNEFTRMIAYLKGKFTYFEIMEWKCVQIGINCDYTQLRLDGVSSISLSRFTNAWMQIYQKAQDKMRIEMHITPKELKLDEAVCILSTLSNIPYEQMPIKPLSDRDKGAYA